MRRLSISTIAIALIAAGCGSGAATTREARAPVKPTHHKRVHHKKVVHHRRKPHKKVVHHRKKTVTTTTTATTTYTPPQTTTTTYTPPQTTTTTVAPTTTHQVTTTVQHHPQPTTTTHQGYCLSVADVIATPDGSIPVAQIKPGMSVWSTDSSGQRISVKVVRVHHTAVPASHLMVRLRLADGRGVLASLGHPLPDGAQISTLVVGQRFEGTTVVSDARVSYGSPYTYDLLPAGPTHTYFADGVLLGSTLAPSITRPF